MGDLSLPPIYLIFYMSMDLFYTLGYNPKVINFVVYIFWGVEFIFLNTTPEELIVPQAAFEAFSISSED